MVRLSLPTLMLFGALGALTGGCRSSSQAPSSGERPAQASEPAPVRDEVARDATSASPKPAPETVPAVHRTKDDDPHLPVLVSFVGDCTLGSDYRSRHAEGSFHKAMDALGNDFSLPMAGVQDVLGTDDLTVANLETTLTQKARPASEGTFVFTGKPEYAQILKLGSVDVVTLANNHTYDFGSEGITETTQALDAAGIAWFGAQKADIRSIRGLEIVNLGYVGGLDKVATRVRRDVEKYKRRDNVVIVSFHWGLEGSNAALDDQKRLGHETIDAGADLVVGHHPHVIQGIEDYKGRKIVYSLGNFVFGGNGNPADKDAIIFQQAFAKAPDGKAGPVANTARAVPVRISSRTDTNDFRPVVLTGAEKERVLARLAEYSKPLGPR